MHSEQLRRLAFDRRILVLVAIVAVIVVARMTGVSDYMSLAALARHRAMLAQFAAQHFAMAVLAYVTTYMVVVALSLPGSQFLTISGGLLFGVMTGAFFAVIGATIGASILFLFLTQTLGGKSFAALGGKVEEIAVALRKDAWSYLLILRLLPLAPFFAVNLAAVLVGVTFRQFFLTTLVGIIPGAFAYASFGAGLGSAFDAQADPQLSDLLTPQLVLAVGGLWLLAIAAIPVKRILQRDRR